MDFSKKKQNGKEDSLHIFPLSIKSWPYFWQELQYDIITINIVYQCLVHYNIIVSVKSNEMEHHKLAQLAYAKELSRTYTVMVNMKSYLKKVMEIREEWPVFS